MRTWLVVIAVISGCQGKKNKADDPAVVEQALAIPVVEVATVLAKDTGTPPYLLLTDDRGMRIAASGSWADLDAKQLKISKLAIAAADLESFEYQLREDFHLGIKPLDSIAKWDERADSPPEEIKLEDRKDRMPTGMTDDPPPPEEEDKPDDGEDESGGTGTAMALEEGKMGKQDSDRAEGQYKMRNNQEDPVLARQQAIERARSMGLLGNERMERIGKQLDGWPARSAQAEGAVIDTLDPLRSMILMAPTAKATRLIEVIAITRGAIAVSHRGKVRPLRIQFDLRNSGKLPPDSWVEVRVTTQGVTVEAVPDKATDLTDLKQLGAAIGSARKAREVEDDAPVDVLVASEVDVQRLIDVLVTLDVAGVKLIGIGPLPPADELARRGKRIPRIAFGQPNAQGDLDKALIRRSVKARLPNITACYEKALALNPAISGTVMTQFLITPTGAVSSVSGAGVDPDLANCIAGVIEEIEFPKPKGGGMVQVNYPFIVRP